MTEISTGVRPSMKTIETQAVPSISYLKRKHAIWHDRHLARGIVPDPEANWAFEKGKTGVDGYEYPEEGCNWRIGVVRRVLSHPRDFDVITRILNTPFTEDITRNMARVVVTEEMLKSESPEVQRVLRAGNLEGIIPLDDSRNTDLDSSLAGCYQLVFGTNSADRKTPKDVMEAEMTAAEEVIIAARENSQDPEHERIAQEVRKSLDFIRLDKRMRQDEPDLTRDLLRSYKELLDEKFGEGNADDILGEEDSVIIVAVPMLNRRHVVGGIIASKDPTILQRDGKSISLNTYEVEGAVTRDEFQGAGIFGVLSTELMRDLAQLQPGVDVVFGYSNLNEHTVFKAAGRAGRTFVAEIAREFDDLPIKPAEGQNYVDGRYVDDGITFLSGNELRGRYKYRLPDSNR